MMRLVREFLFIDGDLFGPTVRRSEWIDARVYYFSTMTMHEKNQTWRF